MKRNELKRILARHSLSHLSDELEGVLEPSVRVIVKKGGGALGSSRLGGLPDLPEGSEWPRVDGVPLMFAAQLRLDELSDFTLSPPLPERGMLAFFFDGMLTGFEAGETPDRCRVLFTEAPTSALERLTPPDDVPSVFKAHPASVASFEQTWTLPAFEEIDGDEFPTIPAIHPIITELEDRESYENMRRGLLDYSNRVLGHPDEVQGGELRFLAVIRRDKGQRFRYEDYSWTREELLTGEMKNLCLLFQASSDTHSGITWGGSGVVYFWIDREDLVQKRFDRVFAMLQST